MQADATANADLFRSEYAAELEGWLRRRFRFFCVVIIALIILIDVLQLFSDAFAENSPSVPATIIIVLFDLVASLAVLGYATASTRWDDADRAELLRAANILILLLGAIAFVTNTLRLLFIPEAIDSMLVVLFFLHLAACLFLPWTPRESIVPFIPLVALWAIGVLVFSSSSVLSRFALVLFGPAVFLPGLAFCAWRLKLHGYRFRVSMIGKQFWQLRSELARARSIHESLFPDRLDDDHIAFTYAFEPAQELGGDFIHTCFDDSGRFHLALIDVTGHGLTAALAVTRLFGELERIHAESPDISPGEVLALLNRYMHFTQIKHGIFATAACCRLDPTSGTLEWASAGHPPAFLRSTLGAVRELAATAPLLGAVDPDAFKSDAQSVQFESGDALIIHTDGVVESRDRQGEEFGMERLHRIINSATPPDDWAAAIADAAHRFRGGRPQDDVLIATVKLKARASFE